MPDQTPFQRAIAELDALHAEDPRRVEVEGQSLPLELWHAGRMSAWLAQVVEAPSELVQLAVRSQHLQRWEVPRSEYPEGRVGYLTWRRDQGKRAGETTARVMEASGYSAQDAAEVSRMIRKQGLGRDPGTQAVEDCACLVFLENYFADFSKQVEHEHLVRIVQMTWKKMSPRARELALALPMSAEARAVVEEALAG
ncbi:DUF4202 domain-containing protein [Halomonas sp. MCCC 1A17488]|uniref:DUF4202 domain-containing protein n=1 Tax=unclassified Halomonas TaxID=2609666 RepID=UPI0018D20B83|nr:MULTISPECIES: DUF4202 domain-containing protein [unclassified Halomonas]MCE8016917.1 DUF4202 domain-containing protein [Halomonas sp. MCCC 1A17488]MCG3240250.1 DUF4202 domain-containing protein [Halomonas sp. MCCC 1A17488]QPP49873.1 DUF4202 domain-containing protein [Halomonas sp. SS10-MC5]